MNRVFICGLLCLFLGACKGTESSVTVSYEGQGRITGEGIDCGSQCETRLYNSWLNSQKDITYKSVLNAEPEPGFEFFAWFGDSGDHFNTPCGTASQCEITVRSECNDLLDFRPLLNGCSELEGNRINQHGIFVAEGSVLTSDSYADSTRCLVTVSGQLQCWGISGGATNTPDVNDASGVKVSEGSACATTDGGLICWGSESIQSNQPSISNLVDFDVSDDTACAIDGGQVKCWGETEFLEPIPDFTDATAIWLDRPMACVQDQEQLKCWGPLAAGQSNPPSLSDVKAIAAIDDISDPGFSCALDGNQLRCWGEQQFYTTRLNGLVNPAEFTLNELFLCCRDEALGVRCLDNSADGEAFLMPYELQDNTQLQLGVNGNLCSTDSTGIECWNMLLPETSPTRPISMIQPDDFDTARDGGCAIKGNQLQCWGIHIVDDVPSRVSINQPTSVATNGSSVCVGGLDGVECFSSPKTPYKVVEYVPDDLTEVTELAMSWFYGCAIHGGQVTCWGDDVMGVLEVPTLKNPTQLALGRYHACALDDTGVVCWGEKVAAGR